MKTDINCTLEDQFGQDLTIWHCVKIKGDSLMSYDRGTAAMNAGYRLWIVEKTAVKLNEVTLTDAARESQIRPLIWKGTWGVKAGKDTYQDY